MDELYDVVDKNGRKIGTATWTECHTKGLLHKNVHGLVFKDNSRKEILIKRRRKDAVQGANQWEIAVAGHILSGKKPRQEIIRELKEELFSKVDMPKKIKIQGVCTYMHNDLPNNFEIAYLFEIVYPGPFSLDTEETSGESRWISLNNFLDSASKSPDQFAKYSVTAVEQYIKNRTRKDS